MLATCLLATALIGQHFRESPHDAFHRWPQIRRSPTAAAKRAKRHAAAEQSRHDLDRALEILHSPPSPLRFCPCTQPGRNAFE